MLSFLYPRLRKRSPLFIYGWDRVIKDNRQLLEYHTDRFSKLDFVLNDLTKRIKACILTINVKDMMQYDNYLDLYLSYIEPTRFTIENTFNNVFPSGLNGPWLGKNATYEQPIMVQCVDPLGRLPLDESYDVWKNIRPIRIHYHDSIELTYNLGNKLNFKVFNPSVFIYTIDITKFIFKYLKFVESIEDKNNIDTYIDKYIYHDLFIPLLDDLFNIWCFNIVNRVLDDDFNLKSLTDSQLGNKNISATVVSGIKQLSEKAEDLSNNTVSFEDFLTTNFFNGDSYIDLISDVINNTRTYNLIQYKHLEFLLELPYIKMLYNMNKRNDHLLGHRIIDVVYERAIINYRKNNVGLNYDSRILRDYVDDQLLSME